MNLPQPKPTNKPAEPKPDLVKHLRTARGTRSLWILLGITIVTLPDLVKSGWWLAPCITALVWKYM